MCEYVGVVSNFVNLNCSDGWGSNGGLCGLIKVLKGSTVLPNLLTLNCLLVCFVICLFCHPCDEGIQFKMPEIPMNLSNTSHRNYSDILFIYKWLIAHKEVFWNDVSENEVLLYLCTTELFCCVGILTYFLCVLLFVYILSF